jgi:hypothetical protein
MLKSDQQEKVLTTTQSRSTSETKLRWIPNDVNKEQEIQIRNHKSGGYPHLKPWSTSETKNLMKTQTTKQRITKELHLSNQNLMELNLNNPNVHLVHTRNKTSDGSEKT